MCSVKLGGEKSQGLCGIVHERITKERGGMESTPNKAFSSWRKSIIAIEPRSSQQEKK